MSKPYRSASAVSFVVLASMIAGCAAPQGSVASASYLQGKRDGDVGLATRAAAALSANNLPLAIDFAERAVAKTPDDAGFRALLGNAYFAAGRFWSAESAYKDSLTIYSNQPRVVLKLALVEIALGKKDEALAFLDAGHAVLDASDYGLALALAGHTDEALAVLEPAARERGADATVRQNLALAYAFGGDWAKARVIAAQDVPADQLDSRIQQWMQLAKPAKASDQVASLVGVTPAAVDHGQPLQLALHATETRLAEAAPIVTVPTKVAPAPQPMLAPVPQPKVAEAAPPQPAAPPAPPPPQFVEAVTAAPAPEPVQAVAPAPPPPRHVASTIHTIAAAAVSEAREVLAAVMPHRDAPVAAVARARRVAAAAPRPRFRRGNSTTVVQLGAYGSPQRVLAAWDNAARKYGALKAYLPVSARFASPKGVFFRLSVRGFATTGEANALCAQLHRKGGSCFVRNFAGDTPVQYASR
jgi:D-alanyl-D-alanine carboxypeptidase